MHFVKTNLYTFIDDFNEKKILSLKKNNSVIYRNYQKKLDLRTVIKFNKLCKKNRLKLYLANNIKLALQANLDGAYIPSFNRSLNLNNYRNNRKNFTILGSAHNIVELKFKEKQGVDFIFLSPLFLTKNYQNNLGIIKFNLISKETKKPIIALGGIRKNNLNKIKLIKAVGLSGITLFNS
ncbi:thiamine phosphate synthase [Pelagibacterales bacterium SAG-MED43]|nr:thiamine phosphate synthase [Pelagibacterales bacterium SAG-MED43]